MTAKKKNKNKLQARNGN